MVHGKCKDPRATLILCAFAPVSGSAPVLVSAFGASADTSRRQEMQVGDLVVFRSDTVPGIIVSERPVKEQTKVPRIGVLWIDCNDVSWEPAEYLKVISEKQ
jgi:hypothetical protein